MRVIYQYEDKISAMRGRKDFQALFLSIMYSLLIFYVVKTGSRLVERNWNRRVIFGHLRGQ